MKRPTLVLAALGLLLGGVGRANAGFIGVAGGAGDPGATLGPYTMTPFALDNEAGGNSVTSLASPLGGAVSFSYAVESFHALSLGQWSGTPPNSYAADVYFNYDTGNALTLTLPSNTAAFYLYVEPNSYAVANPITVTAQDGASVTQTVQSNTTGAKYFGFYTTGNDLLSTLTISQPPGGFFVGEFAIAGASPSTAPEPSTLILLGVGAVSLIGYGWRRRRGGRRTES